MWDDTPRLLVRCTAKLLREIRTVGDVIESDGPLGSWYANLLRIDRRKCVLFTHSETLFSVLALAVRKPRISSLDSLLLEHLSVTLSAEGLGDWAAANILRLRRGAKLARTTSRSVLGSMNDLARQAEVAIYAQGGVLASDSVALAHHLNRTPMGGIGMRYPIDEFREWCTTHSA